MQGSLSEHHSGKRLLVQAFAFCTGLVAASIIGAVALVATPVIEIPQALIDRNSNAGVEIFWDLYL